MRSILLALVLAASACLTGCPVEAAPPYQVIPLAPAAGLLDAKLSGAGGGALLYSNLLLLLEPGGGVSSLALPAGLVPVSLSPVRNGAVYVRGYSAATPVSYRVTLPSGPAVLYWRFGWITGELDGQPWGVDSAGCQATAFYTEPPPLCIVCCPGGAPDLCQDLIDQGACSGLCPPYDPNWSVPAAWGACNFSEGVDTPAWVFASGPAMINVGGGVWRAAVTGGGPAYSVALDPQPACFADGSPTVAVLWEGRPRFPYWPDVSSGWAWFQPSGGATVQERYGSTSWTTLFRPIATNGIADVGQAWMWTGELVPTLLDDQGFIESYDLTPWLGIGGKPLAINDAGLILGIVGGNVSPHVVLLIPD